MLPPYNFCKSTNILTLAQMKKIKLILLIALPALVFQSCEEKQGHFKMEELVGNWKDEGTNKQFYEEWKASESGLEGLGFVLSKGDTIMIENMNMVERDSNLEFEVRVNNQNRGQVISFKATDCSENFVAFENPEHDFPQSIEYSLVSKNELKVTLSGVERDEQKEVEFNFSRLK